MDFFRIKELAAQYPNDQDFGRAIRKEYILIAAQTSGITLPAIYCNSCKLGASIAYHPDEPLSAAQCPGCGKVHAVSTGIVRLVTSTFRMFDVTCPSQKIEFKEITE